MIRKRQRHARADGDAKERDAVRAKGASGDGGDGDALTVHGDSAWAYSCASAAEIGRY